MWWDEQNLDKAREDRSGHKWHFRVWHAVVDLKHVARVFFWDDARDFCGVVLIPKSGRTDVRAIRNIIQKIASDSAFRLQHLREISFPLERFYESYPAFPEEGLSE